MDIRSADGIERDRGDDGGGFRLGDCCNTGGPAKSAGTEQERLKAALATSVRNFSQEFSYDFQQLCESFEVEPEASYVGFLRFSRCGRYEDGTRPRALPSWLLICTCGERTGARGLIWNLRSGRAIASRDRLARRAGIAAAISGPSRRQKCCRLSSDREAVYYPWTFHEETPALVRPLFRIAAERCEPEAEGDPASRLSGGRFKRGIPDAAVPARSGGSLFWNLGFHGGRAQRQSRLTRRSICLNCRLAAADFAPDASVNLFDSVGEEAQAKGHPRCLQAANRGSGNWWRSTRGLVWRWA